jgi:hypothetical protein
VLDLFVRLFQQLREQGYFHEAFGYECVDAGYVEGKLHDIEMEMRLSIRKRNLYPIAECALKYTEHDLFDVIEFLFQHVSKPIDGYYHSYNDCGKHWSTFNQAEGRKEFLEKVNGLLDQYEKGFELSGVGEVLQRAEVGFEQIFTADLPSTDVNIKGRLSAAILCFGATVRR